MEAEMKLKLLVAILRLAVGQIVAQSDGPLAVVSATVSEWDGCLGKLNVVINIPSSWHGPLPVVFSSNIGKSCPYPTPYSYGCYSTGSLGTFDIRVGAPTQATWINAAVGMDYMPNSVHSRYWHFPPARNDLVRKQGHAPASRAVQTVPA